MNDETFKGKSRRFPKLEVFKRRLLLELKNGNLEADFLIKALRQILKKSNWHLSFLGNEELERDWKAMREREDEAYERWFFQGSRRFFFKDKDLDFIYLKYLYHRDFNFVLDLELDLKIKFYRLLHHLVKRYRIKLTSSQDQLRVKKLIFKILDEIKEFKPNLDLRQFENFPYFPNWTRQNRLSEDRGWAERI